MGSRCRSWAVLPIVLAISIAWPALADRDAAKELFRSGRASYQRGDYIAAAHAFEQAYGEDPTAESLYNAGLSWHGAGRLARAANRYRSALDAGGLDPALAREAERLLGELAPKLGVIDVTAPDGSVSIGDGESIAPPAKVFVEPGTHPVRLRRPDGRESVESARVSAGGVARVTFGAVRAQPPPRAPAAREPQVEPDATSDAPTTQRVLGWTALGVSVAASATAIYLGTRAVAARDRWVDSDLKDIDEHDRAVRLKTWTNVAWGGAAVLGVTGVVLLLTASDRSALGLSVTPESAGARYRARF